MKPHLKLLTTDSPAPTPTLGQHIDDLYAMLQTGDRSETTIAYLTTQFETLHNDSGRILAQLHRIKGTPA